jgi:hypothetical protein
MHVVLETYDDSPFFLLFEDFEAGALRFCTRGIFTRKSKENPQ